MPRMNNLETALLGADDSGFVFAVDVPNAKVVPISLRQYVAMPSSDPLLAHVRLSKPAAERALLKLLGASAKQRN